MLKGGCIGLSETTTVKNATLSRLICVLFSILAGICNT